MRLRMQRVFLCACILLLPESEKHHTLENNESQMKVICSFSKLQMTFLFVCGIVKKSKCIATMKIDGGDLMDSLSEISVVYQHKQQLEHRLEALKEEAKHAEQLEQDAQMRCERENLDVRKFESNDFKQFWFKLRGQYEARVLENNEKAAEAMRALNDAKSHAFDVAKEKEDVERQLKALDGVEDAYKKALLLHVEHLDYSIHREEIIRMQEKINYDSHQLKLLAEARDLGQLAGRKVKQLESNLQELDAAKDEKNRDKVEVAFISGLSELRIQLHQLEQILDEIDAWETEILHFSERLTVNTLDLFFNKESLALANMAREKAERELQWVTDGLVECETTIMHVVVEVEETKSMHQRQLETFISETDI